MCCEKGICIKKESCESWQVTHLIYIKLGLPSGQLSVACAKLANEIVAVCADMRSDIHVERVHTKKEKLISIQDRMQCIICSCIISTFKHVEYFFFIRYLTLKRVLRSNHLLALVLCCSFFFFFFSNTLAAVKTQCAKYHHLFHSWLNDYHHKSTR